uniref:Arabidopsis retrotransposon Orf1 C-terminal domain-containing protein n=1 Tax=Opuntia streptacantha TaxID=393608 RepID=A0A7C8ZKD9_OPUST
MAPKKYVKTTAASTSRAPGARGNTSLPHVINKYRLVFVDAEHESRYDSIVTRKISAPSYLDRQMLETMSSYDDLRRLLVNLGWANFVELQEPVYERLVWDFMSSLVVDLRRKFAEFPGYIHFRLFNVTHEMHLVRFNELLHLPAYGALIPEHEDFIARSFWHTITCFGKPYEARSSKATLICNPILRYFQRLTANHVFAREDS